MASLEPILFVTQPMECSRCGYDFVTVHPSTCERVECPQCGFMEQCPPVPTNPNNAEGE